MNDYLKNLTKEDRELLREKAKQARILKKEQYSYLKQDFLDKPVWVELASTYGVRLPAYYRPGIEIKYLRRAASKLKIDLKDFIDTTGYTNVKQFAEGNPNWPSYALVGLLLEYHNETVANSQLI